MGKGSTPRPFSVSNQEYSNRWDAIFGRDNDQKDNKTQKVEPDRSPDACHGGGSNNATQDSGQAQIP